MLLVLISRPGFEAFWCWSTRLRDFSSLASTATCGTTVRLPLRERCRLRDGIHGLDLHRQIPVHDRDRRDANFFAHHDGAGAFIDHDAGWPVGLNFQRFHIRK